LKEFILFFKGKKFIFFLEYDQWLEFDLGHPSTVTSLITKGRADTNNEQWVTKYKLSFSNDTHLWIYYKDKSQIEPKVCVFNHLTFILKLKDFVGICR
jgi:hypothetical protein